MQSTNKPAVAFPRFAAVVVFLALATFAATSCDRSPLPTPAGNTGGQRAADKVYTARGQITMLPAKDHPTAELVIKHEAINDFVNPGSGGSRRGMASMEMPLPPDKSIAIAEFSVGDVVEFDLSVWYTPGFASIESYRVTRMKRLPADTALHFGPAAPTLGDPAPKP